MVGNKETIEKNGVIGPVPQLDFTIPVDIIQQLIQSRPQSDYGVRSSDLSFPNVDPSTWNLADGLI